MKCLGPLLLIFFSAPIMAQKATIVQPSITVASAAPVSLVVEYHPAETVRFTFSLKMNLTTRVDPSIPIDKVLSFTPRQYQVDGEIVATFTPTQPGEPLRGTVQFQGLTVKNWISSAKVADMEARLRFLEATPTNLTGAAGGKFEPSQMPAYPLPDPYVLDVEDLDSIAQALVISRISSQPLAPGQQRESADFPIPGMVKPGIKLSVLTEYITDFPIARHPNAEVRLSMTVPNQSHPVSSQSNTSMTFERLYGAGVWTYLLDLDAHQISFLHKTIRTETGYSMESMDSNESVRIPANLFTVNKTYEVTARRVVANASPEREADLAAYEKTLQAPPRTALEGSGAAASASPGGEVSLGDIARRLRDERAAQGSPQAETELPSIGESVPADFKLETFPSGVMTGFVPLQASEDQRTKQAVYLSASVGIAKTQVVITMVEETVPPSDSPAPLLDGSVKALQGKAGVRVLQSEKKSINGEPAVVIEFLDAHRQPFQALQAIVISGNKALASTCGTAPTDFPKVESLCRTVVESIRAR